MVTWPRVTSGHVTNERHGGQHGVTPHGWLSPAAAPLRRGVPDTDWANRQRKLPGFACRNPAAYAAGSPWPLELFFFHLQPTHMCQAQSQNMFARAFGQLVVAVVRARAFRRKDFALVIDAQ